MNNYYPHACRINTLHSIVTVLRVHLTLIREDSTCMRAGSTRMQERSGHRGNASLVAVAFSISHTSSHVIWFI
jgi:hypothetical protein